MGVRTRKHVSSGPIRPWTRPRGGLWREHKKTPELMRVSDSLLPPEDLAGTSEIPPLRETCSLQAPSPTLEFSPRRPGASRPQEFLKKVNYYNHVESCHSVSGKGRATVHPYSHTKRIVTEGQEGPSIAEAVLGANLDVNIAALPPPRPSPVGKAGVDDVVCSIERLILPSPYLSFARYSQPRQSLVRMGLTLRDDYSLTCVLRTIPEQKNIHSHV